MFGKVLIARRGEVAARVARTCRRLGVRTVALYTDDAEAAHVDACDEAHSISASPNDDLTAQVIAAAVETGVDAIYPGYASYTLHHQLADACEKADFVCIGLDADVLRLVRDRVAVAKLIEEVGANAVPWALVADETEAYRECDKVGFPLLLKSPVGSTGAGHLLAEDDDEVVTQFRAFQSKSPGPVFLERMVERARDIEVLVASDGDEVVALCEQETSIVSEGRGLLREAPSPELIFKFGGEALREALFDVAIRVARAVPVAGLLGVRFLLDARGRFTVRGIRLGLPNLHGAAEAVTNIDLVEVQLRLAAGESIWDELRHIDLSGHAVTAQVLADRSASRETPIEEVRFPTLPHRSARIEPAVLRGGTVPPDDWPRLGKVTCAAPIRHNALLMLDRVLAAIEAPPIPLTVGVIRQVLTHEGFRAGQYDCSLTETLARAPLAPRSLPPTLIEAKADGGKPNDRQRRRGRRR